MCDSTPPKQPIREEYGFDVSEAAIGWCEEDGAIRIADLAGRVVEPETFADVWIARCQSDDE